MNDEAGRRQRVREARDRAYGLMRGAFDALVIPIVVGATILIVWAASPLERDKTDAMGWGAPRSNMRLHIDHGTGCEYLSPRNGSLSPRLDADGKHICRRPD